MHLVIWMWNAEKEAAGRCVPDGVTERQKFCRHAELALQSVALLPTGLERCTRLTR